METENSKRVEDVVEVESQETNEEKHDSLSAITSGNMGRHSKEVISMIFYN